MDFGIWEVVKISASLLSVVTVFCGSLLGYIWYTSLKSNRENFERDEKARDYLKGELERHIDYRVDSLKDEIRKHDSEIDEMYKRTEIIGKDLIDVKGCMSGIKRICEERHK